MKSRSALYFRQIGLKCAATGALSLLLASLSAGAEAQSSVLAQREAAAKASPRDAAVQAALGTAYLRAGRFSDAAKQMERAEALTPLDPMAVTRRAEVAIAQGDLKRARGQCQRLFQEQKGPPLAHVCMARAFLAWNRSERAFESLQVALGQAPQLTEAQLVLGHAHRIRGQVSEAEAAYKLALENRAQAAEANLGLGRLYAAAGRKQEGLAALREGLLLEGDWPELQLELGVLLGEGDEARGLLEQATSGRPGWADAERALGDLLKNAGDLPAASAAYRKAIAADRNHTAAYLGLAEVLLQQNQLDEAEKAVQTGLSLVANDPRATLILGDIQLKKGAVDDAIASFRRASDLDTKNPAGLVRAAEASLAHGRPTLAAAFLDRLLSAHPKHAAALILYGDVMRSRGDKAQAKHYYDRAVSAGGSLDVSRTGL